MKGKLWSFPKNKDIQRVEIETPLCVTNNQKSLGELQELGVYLSRILVLCGDCPGPLRDVANSVRYSRYVELHSG